MTTEVLPCSLVEASIESVLKLLAHPSFIPVLDQNVVFVQGEQQLREMYRRTGKVNFPVMAVRMDSGSKNRSSYHGLAFKHQGVVGSYDGDKKVFYKWHLRPVTVNLIVRYITNSFGDVMAMFNAWLFKDRSLNFDLNYEGFSFPVAIQCEINDDVTFPPLEDGETGEIFNVETTLIVHTYVGEIRSVPEVSNTAQVSLVIPFQNGATVTVSNVTYSGDDS